MSSIIMHVENEVGFLLLNRPEACHALDCSMLQELLHIITHLNTRFILVTGSGEKAFCAGADIKKMAAMTSSECEAFISLGQQTLKTLESAPAITIAALNGLTLGGGLELALACDFIFAAKGIKIGLPEVGLGLIPGFGGTQRLTKYLGSRIAMEFILSAQIFDAEKALSMGLINGCLSQEELIPYCMEFCKKLHSLPREAQINAKKAILAFDSIAEENGYTLESKLFAECFNHPETKSHLDQFLKKKEKSS